MTDNFIIFGETFDSEDKIKREAEAFIEYFHDIDRGRSIDETPSGLLFKFALKRWQLNEFDQPNAADLKAIENYYLRHDFWGAVFQAHFKQSPDGKIQRQRTAIALKLHRKQLREGELVTLSDEQNKQALFWGKKSDEAKEKLFAATNNVELCAAKEAIAQALKEYQKAHGFRPCEASDCLQYLTGRQKKYCSDKCRERQKQRRQRANNPKGVLRSRHKYNAYLKQQGDF